MDKLKRIRELQREAESPRLGLTRIAEISREIDKLNEDGEVEDATKGEVSVDKEESEPVEKGFCIENAKEGFAIYRDYNNMSSDGKLKRLVR